MSAYLITRTTVRFIIGMAVCAVWLLGPSGVVAVIFGGAS